MAQQTDATTDVPDSIDKHLVAQTCGQVGDERNPRNDDDPMRYLNIAGNAWDVDTERALLIDSENPDRLLYAWTNDERQSWSVKDAGTQATVSAVAVDTPDDVDEDKAYAQEWLEILIDELRYDVSQQATRRSVSDEITFCGIQKLKLRDADGREAKFAFRLNDGNE